MNEAKRDAPIPEWAIREAVAFEPHIGTHSYRVRVMEQVASALAAAYARGREDAAKVCDGLAASYGRIYAEAKAWDRGEMSEGSMRDALEEGAAAIRAGGA